MNEIAKNEISNNILDGEALQEKLEAILPSAKKHITFISAYMTEAPVKWLYNLSPRNIDIRLVCRLSPSDAVQGSTSIKALKVAMQYGMRVSRLHNLHAKIYSIDDKAIFSGSANFTNNGLILYGGGNLEASTQIQSNSKNIEFINTILESSTSIDRDIIDKMESFILSKKSKNIFDTWPDDIIKDNEGIWSRDFFWKRAGDGKNSDDLKLLGLSSFDVPSDLIKERVRQSRCVRWLTSKLQAQESGELYFGHLSKLLHDDLKDDPTPYRKDVKGLLSNLLSYVETYLSDAIEVSVPGNHSQRVKVIHSI